MFRSIIINYQLNQTIMGIKYKLFIYVILSIILTNKILAAPSPSSYTSGASVSGSVENGYNVGNWNNASHWNNGIPDLSNNDVNTVSAGDSMVYFGSFVINNKVTINVDGIVYVTGSFSAFNSFVINIAPGGRFIVAGSMSVNNNSNATINGNLDIGGSLTVGGGSTTWDGTGTVTIGGTGCDQIPGPFDADANCNDINNPLPVILNNFIVSLNTANQAELSWTTASEEDNDYFEVQRSSDAVNFETIGSVDGNGTSKSEIDYSFIDEFPASGISYYRLKQVDYDGKITYHRIIALNNTNEVSNVFHLYPNPTYGIQYFQLDEGVELLNLVLTSIDGNVIPLENETILDTKKIDYSGIDRGFYILNAITSKGGIKKRISLK